MPLLYKSLAERLREEMEGKGLITSNQTGFRKGMGIVDNELQNTANDFLKTVKRFIEQFGSENVFNSDQSGFQLEIHSGRSLFNVGVKKVERVVQFISSTTHSYTIQPIISCNGNLLPPLFIVLKEANGIFGPRVQETLFTTINVIVKASKSGKMISEDYFVNIGSNSVLLINSWIINLCFTIKVLLENDYQLNFKFENINNRLKNIIMASDRKISSSSIFDNTFVTFFFIYEIQSIVSSVIKNISFEVIRLNIAAFNSPLDVTTNKLREFIRVYKNPLPRDKRSNVVYKISCRSCDASYVGQMCRQLRSRITEHKNHIRWNTYTRNVITEHRLQEDHDFDWDNVTILDEEPHYRKRLISEMMFIRRQTHGLNLQTDMEGLPKAYLSIIDKL
ncbi:hypothetical protein ALC57_15678 [Trachymyrmex cornetzi]|uniref:Reverse transcriptase domain-containing protein n=1 Tax=Trachymyrmex cornetzi TaxID=471704 RepID=A0A151IWF4_9HYME|nr:hypothetical protein ALC57_15678 [Trachymyrmex cornetzi]